MNQNVARNPYRKGEIVPKCKGEGQALTSRFEAGADEPGGGGAGAAHGGRRQGEANAGEEGREGHPRPRRCARVFAARARGVASPLSLHSIFSSCVLILVLPFDLKTKAASVLVAFR
jgi:hypothetical protein